MLRNKLETEVQYLPGVGPRRASLLRSELEVSTVGDLLHVYPFRYVDRSSIQKIADVRSENAYVQILGTVVSSEMPQGKGAKRLTVTVQDSSGAMELVFFKGIKYTYERLKPGGTFCGCFYVRGGCKRTDWFISHLYQPKGFFTPPYETEQSLRRRLSKLYKEAEVTMVEGMGCFCCRK